MYYGYWLNPDQYMLMWWHAGAFHMMMYDVNEIEPDKDIIWMQAR